MKAVVLVGSVLCALPGSLLAQPMTPARIASSFAAKAAPLPRPLSFALPRQESSRASPGDSPVCYADCDGSGTLTFQDVNCFYAMFNAGNAYANCDASTTAPVLNVSDFVCFTNAYVIGCP